MGIMSIENQTLAHFRHFRHLRHFIRRGGFSSLFTKVCSTTVEIALQIHSILTNKPNFPRFSPKNDDLTKNKPNSNPIQTQFYFFIVAKRPKCALYSENTDVAKRPKCALYSENTET